MLDRLPTRRALVLALALVPLGLRAAWAEGRVSFETSELIVETGGGRHRFTVELADNDQRRSLGLMYRNSLGADAGMLFDFKSDQMVAMWMRNTRIPLDMLFIARDGRVVNIAERTVPFSEASIPSEGPVRAVLELNGGTARRLGVKPGDRVIHPIFRNTSGSRVRAPGLGRVRVPCRQSDDRAVAVLRSCRGPSRAPGGEGV